MKSIKKTLLFAAFITIAQISQIHADANIQAQIHAVIKKHQTKSLASQTTAELQKFLEAMKKDIQNILKNAPNTVQYKELKKAVDLLNPKELAANLAHFKVILKNVDKDIKDDILNFLPLHIKAFLLI